MRASSRVCHSRVPRTRYTTTRHVLTDEIRKKARIGGVVCVSTSTHTRCARGRTPQRVCRQPSRSFTVPLLFHRVVVVVVVVVTATDFANSRAFFTRRRPTNTERGWAVVVDPGPWWKWKKHRCLDPAAPRINHGRTTCLLSCHTHTGGSYLNSLSLSLSPFSLLLAFFLRQLSLWRLPCSFSRQSLSRIDSSVSTIVCWLRRIKVEFAAAMRAI